MQIHASDNVATLLEDAGVEPVSILGSSAQRVIGLAEPVAMGHKVALQPIPPGSPVVKYGVTIGLSRREIRPGEWVHLHNCHSRVDARSYVFDAKSGAASDNVYE